MSTPRILEIGMHFDPSGGGADRYFAGLLEGLQTIGADVTAAAFGQPGAGIKSPVTLGPPDLSLPNRLRAMKALRPQIERPGALVATHFALYALPLAARLRKLPHVVHFHGPWAGESKREGEGPWAVAAKKFVERYVYFSASRLITLSSAFRDILCSDYRIPPARVTVVPGGVEVSRFKPSVDRAAARVRFGWPADARVILCVRRLVKRMGLESLLEAFAQIAPAQPGAVLVIAGKGPLAEPLREQAAALGLGARVRFPGFVPDCDLPEMYSAADFSIVPSVALEGFGLITLESLASGTPVLVTPIGGLPETVSSLDRSLILSGCTAKDVAAGLERGLRGGLPGASDCRRYAEKNFAWPEIARRVLSVYQEAVNDPLR